MKPIITAFAASPDRGRGLARDMRVRWALEEAGQPYDVRLLSFAELKEPEHRALQPFGQIPTYEDGEVALFESGAILLHLAERHAGLLPTDPDARGRAISWLFAALNTIEPPILEQTMATLLEREESWYAARQPILEARTLKRLAELADALAEREWLVGDFSVADVMMVTVLRRLESSGTLDAKPALLAYIARGVARPAYQRAFAAQLAVFEASGAR